MFSAGWQQRAIGESIVRHITNMTHTRTHPGAVIAAIPAKNEVETIGNCLQGLACQRGAKLDAVVICLNNCTDDSAKLVRLVAPRLPFAVHALQVSLPSEQSFAGMARRIAMDLAAELAGPDGILLSTDADGQAALGWVAGNLAALGEGVDAVAGRAEIEPVGARLIPAHLHAADAEECAYAALLDEIHSLIDPDPADPWPRHDEESGASIAVTVAAYRHAGGIPAVTLGEDRAFFAALRRIDARIRHARGIRVTVSARTVGRAAGGMADTMLRRMTQMDVFLDDRLEFVAAALHRASLRAQMRTAWRAKRAKSPPPVTLAAALGLPVGSVADLLSERYFGAAWSEAEARSPALQRRRVPVEALPAQTAIATAVRDELRSRAALSLAEDPGDTPVPAAVA